MENINSSSSATQGNTTELELEWLPRESQRIAAQIDKVTKMVTKYRRELCSLLLEKERLASRYSLLSQQRQTENTMPQP
jgi:hypothetical protein